MTAGMLDRAGTGAAAGGRLSPDRALALLEEAPLLDLGEWARAARDRLHPEPVVTFVIDRNINYTNVCVNRCAFCAFYRDPDAPDAYVLPRGEIFRKIEETLACGGTQILMQGGLHPDLDLGYFEGLFRAVKERYDVHLHALSPPEIAFLAEREGLSVAEVLERLRRAGLDSIPGGGAEILSDRVRARISPRKIDAGTWLRVMEEAHGLGLPSTATMMFGSVERPAEIVEHLERIRSLQDRTGGFTAFIPWSYQPGNTALGGEAATGVEYLRVLAVSRLYLDNVANIQASWVTQGPKMGQVALLFGANDLGSTMLEENVVAAAGVRFRMTPEEMVRLIRDAGFVPAQRDTRYRVLRRWDAAGEGT